MNTANSSNKTSPTKNKLPEEILKKRQKTQLNNLINIVLQGKQLKFKVCQKTNIDNSHTNRTRTGRFIFFERQHKTLIDNDGYYFFLIIDNRQPCNPKDLYDISEGYIVPAKSLNLDFTGLKSITWKSLTALIKE